MTIQEQYEEFCRTPSDINEHLPTLKSYADRCEHVTEFGVRGCVSLHAFLASNAKTVVAYDIANVAVPSVDKLQFINADVLTVEIEPTDLLFIDTLHTGEQLRAELRLHANKVRRYLIFHDTAMFGQSGENGSEGLLRPIFDFLDDNPRWKLIIQHINNNGLTILERTP